MRVELNRLNEYVSRNLLCIVHSDRPMHGPSADINYLETRYASPARLALQQPFDTLRPARESVSPFLGSVSLYDVGDDGRRPPELVCAFRLDSYKPQHGLWDGDRLWVVGAEHVAVYDAELRSIGDTRDPWLAGNHTIAADGRGGLLVSCSASDSVLTLDAETGSVKSSRRMPEDLYGLNYPLNRHDSVVEHYISNDNQLSHVNCAWPWRRGILVSSLIQGALGWFDPEGQYYELLRGFVGCHGARVRSDIEEIFFSDSCSGMLVFLDLQGCVIRRVGTGSRWLHDAVQIRGEVFAAAPFDQNEVLLLNIATREVLGRISCGARGRPQFLSFGAQPGEFGDAADGHRVGARVSALRSGQMTSDRALITAALRRQHEAMVNARDAIMAELRDQVARSGVRDSMITRLREEYAEAVRVRDAIIDEHHRAVKVRDAIIAEMDVLRAREVGLRDAELNRRDRLLGELATNLQTEVNTRDRLLGELAAHLRVEVDRRDRLLGELETHLQNEVNTRDRLLGELETHLQSEVNRRDRLLGELETHLQSEVNRRDRLLGELQTEVNTRDRLLGELQTDLQTEVNTRDRLQAEVNKRDRLLADVETRLQAEIQRRDSALIALRLTLDRMTGRTALRRLRRLFNGHNR